jgi:MFS family permease
MSRIDFSATHMKNSPFRLLAAQAGFIQFFGARLCGVTGNQMLMVALAWHMYDLTASAWDLGLVGLFQFVPALLLTLFSGHVVDRFHRARILGGCLGVQALIALLLVWSTASELTNRELILGLSILLGVCRSFQMPAQQALVPLLVPSHLLQRAVAFSSSGMQVAIICGPALGGVIYVYGPLWVYFVCAGLLLLGSRLAFGIRYPHQRLAKAADRGALLAGISFVWRHKILLGVTSLDLFAVLLGGAVALLPVYAKDVLHTGPEGLGLLRSAPAFGAVLAAALQARWPLSSHVGHRLLMAVAIFGIAMIVFGLSTNFLLSLGALAISGAADSVSVVTRTTLMQLETPDALRGRVSAVNSIFIGASNQLGEFESGALAEFLGPVPSVVVGGLGAVLVAVLWRRIFPSLAQRNRM